MLTGKNNRLSMEERQSRLAEIQCRRDLYEDANLGGYEKIYPLEKEYEDEYLKFLRQAQQLQEEQTGTSTTHPSFMKAVRRFPLKRHVERAPPVENPIPKYRCDELSKIYS
jgi:hypothetical protein